MRRSNMVRRQRLVTAAMVLLGSLATMAVAGPVSAAPGRAGHPVARQQEPATPPSAASTPTSVAPDPTTVPNTGTAPDSSTTVPPSTTTSPTTTPDTTPASTPDTTAQPEPAESARIVAPISGTIRIDTDADGTAETITTPGLTEPAFSAATVDLVCVATGAVLKSTTPAANGTWTLTDLPLDPCTEVAIRVTSTNPVYVLSPAGDTPRTSPPTVGSSATFPYAEDTPPIVLNTLVRPDWELDIKIPIDGATSLPAVYDGAPTFDTTNCAQPGYDCASQNMVVRTADTVTYTLAVTASSSTSSSPTLSNVVVEQTVTFIDGASGNFERIPARCTPGGGGGSTPPSQIVAMPSGTVIAGGSTPPAGTTSIVLRCNLGTWSQTGSAVTFQPVFKPYTTSPNGSSLQMSARTYAVDAGNVPTAVPDGPVEYGPIDITAAPRYDLSKRGFFNADSVRRDIGNGLEAGYITYVVIAISSDRAVGVEALQQPITITEDVVAQFRSGAIVNALTDFRYAIVECIPNTSPFVGTVGGMNGPYGSFSTQSSTVVNSGTCSATRTNPGDQTSDYQLTFNGIDMTGKRYPTVAAGGSSLAAGPYYVASYRVQVFIPLSSIDAADGTPGDGRGSVSLTNRVGGFDPTGVSGTTSNFGDELEPGYCQPESVDATSTTSLQCAPMPTTPPTISNNVAGPTTFNLGAGSFGKYLVNALTPYTNSYNVIQGSATTHDGQATLSPGQTFEAMIIWRNSSVSPGWTNSRWCDVFDNTMAQLAPTSATMTGGSASLYAYMVDVAATATANQAMNSRWIFEYANIPVSGDDPLSGGYDLSTGRYTGTWASMASKRCDDGAAPAGWFTDPNSVPGGIDAVNAVRARPATDPQTGELYVQEPGIDYRMFIPFRVRDTFLGGPHAGDTIPAGAVVANFGAARADQDRPNWTSRAYLPSPENSNSDGDRVTVIRATSALQKQTIRVDGIGDGAAVVGTTGAAVAGNQVVWEIIPTISSLAQQPTPITNVTIVDVLPPGAVYDADCTAAITGGTPATSVEYDTPTAGKTRLTWLLGTITPNTTIPNRRICTGTDPFLTQGTALVNTATLTGDRLLPKSDDHTVVLDQAGGLQLRKTVDAPLDLVNDDQTYSLAIRNLSGTLTVGAPTIIELLPYNGDASATGLTRSPGSNFTGEYALTGAPVVTSSGGAAYPHTMYYTSDAPNTVNQNLNTNTNVWCTQAQFGSAGCPASFADVTALKMVGSANLSPTAVPATSGLTMTFTTQAGDTADPFSSTANKADDRYLNRFTAFSSTYSSNAAFQQLASNLVAVRTVGLRTGDLVFADRDGDGAYDPSIDRLVPDGVTVKLWYLGGADPYLVDTTTTSAGVYHFTDLPAGKYRVEVPGTEFQSGGLLSGWVLTPAPASGDVDENDDRSHDAVAGPDGSIVSNEFTLSATVSGAALTGDEPEGDDIHGVGDPNDSLSNLSIDLALVPPAAIDIEKEICLSAANDCDPEAAVGAGGWSVDSTPGDGPTGETGVRRLGATALWRIVVTNTGEQVLTNVVVTDPVVSGCAATSTDHDGLARMVPGAVVRWTCESTDLTADIAPNTAQVTATPVIGQNPTDTDTANVVIAKPGVYTLVKILDDPVADDSLGDATTYPVTVTCTDPRGTVTEHSVDLPADGTKVEITGIPDGSTCTVTETDADGGVPSYEPADQVSVVNTEPALVNVTNTFPGVSVTKTVVEPLPVTAADGTATVTYDITVKNLAVADDTYDLTDTLAFGEGITIVSATVTNTTGGMTPRSDWDGRGQTTVVADAPIAGQAEHVYTVTVEVTVSSTLSDAAGDCTADIGENGSGYTNSAGVTYHDQTATDDDCTPATRPPSIDIEKEVCISVENDCDPSAAIGSGGWSIDGVAGNGPDTEAAVRRLGATALWRIVVTNTGGLPLSEVTVTDAEVAACAATSAEQGALALMAPGAVVSWTCESTDLTTDIAPNTAEVSGTPPSDLPPVSDTDTANVTIAPPGTLTLAKAIIDPVTTDALGDADSFPVTVTCTDPRGTERTFDVELPADGTTVEVDGIADGSSCTVEELESDGGVPSYSPADPVEVTNEAGAALTVTNTYPGVTLTKSVVDPLPLTDAAGNVTVVYTITVRNAGRLADTYDLSDTLAFGEGITIVSATAVNTTGGVSPNVSWDGVEQTALVSDVPIDGLAAHVYTVTVNATVASTMTDSAGDCTITSGEDGTGSLNSATVTYHEQTNTGSDCAPITRGPSIDIEKEICILVANDCDPTAALGDGGWSVDGVAGNGPETETVERPWQGTALWRIVVTNTGGQTLTDVVVTDPLADACARDSASIPALASVAPAAVVRWTCTSTNLTAAISPNTATVTANPPGGRAPVGDTDTASVTVGKQPPGPTPTTRPAPPLPGTGSDSSDTLRLAASLLLIGVGLVTVVYVSRSRRRTTGH